MSSEEPGFEESDKSDDVALRPNDNADVVSAEINLGGMYSMLIGKAPLTEGVGAFPEAEKSCGCC
jgi:hypothetical protein